MDERSGLRKNGWKLSLVKRRKPLPEERTHMPARGCRTNPVVGFMAIRLRRWHPLRPDGQAGYQIVVSIILTENKQPDLLERWFSHDDLDVRHV
jgi:hypothetical protein